MKLPHVLSLNLAMTSSPSVFRSLVARSVCLTVPLALGITSYAQGPNSDPESAWANVLSLANPPPVSKHANGRKKSQAEINAEIAQGAASIKQASQAAHSFYSSFPGHGHAAEARKLEALCAVRGVDSVNPNETQAAIAVAQAFRQNGSYPAEDRFEVALAVENLNLSANARQGLAAATVQARRDVADALRTEFGDLPALHDYYMQLARDADTATAVDLANRVNQSNAASHQAKDRAQTILDRAALAGKSLGLRLTDLEGASVNLGTGRGKPTLIVAWSMAEADSLASVLQYAKRLEKVDLVYIGLGGSAIDAAQARTDYVRLPGSFCHAPAGQDSRRVINALKIQYTSLPRVCLLDAAGHVIGSGAMRELPALLQQAGL